MIIRLVLTFALSLMYISTVGCVTISSLDKQFEENLENITYLNTATPSELKLREELIKYCYGRLKLDARDYVVDQLENFEALFADSDDVTITKFIAIIEDRTTAIGNQYEAFLRVASNDPDKMYLLQNSVFYEYMNRYNDSTQGPGKLNNIINSLKTALDGNRYDKYILDDFLTVKMVEEDKKNVLGIIKSNNESISERLDLAEVHAKLYVHAAKVDGDMTGTIKKVLADDNFRSAITSTINNDDTNTLVSDGFSLLSGFLEKSNN